MIFEDNMIFTSRGLIPARIMYTCYLAMDPIKLLTYSFINQRLEWQPVIFSSFSTITTLLISINQSFYCSRNICLPNNIDVTKAFFELDMFDYSSIEKKLNVVNYTNLAELCSKDDEDLVQFKQDAISATISFDQIMTYTAYSFITNLNHNYFVAIDDHHLLLTQF